jgi:hypothetical protein
MKWSLWRNSAATCSKNYQTGKDRGLLPDSSPDLKREKRKVCELHHLCGILRLFNFDAGDHVQEGGLALEKEILTVISALHRIGIAFALEVPFLSGIGFVSQ